MSRAVDELLSELRAHLLAQVPELLEVYAEFPEANQELVMPAASLFSNEPKFESLDPYPHSTGEVDTDNKVQSVMIVGSYELTAQLDLWCRNKKERDTLSEKVFQALNPRVTPMGLSLRLANYYDTYGRIAVAGHAFDDSDQSAERREWRTRFDLLGDCKSVLVATDYAIVTTETTFETPNDIPEP